MRFNVENLNKKELSLEEMEQTSGGFGSTIADIIAYLESIASASDNAAQQMADSASN